jgi:hypothetical protein
MRRRATLIVLAGFGLLAMGGGWLLSAGDYVPGLLLELGSGLLLFAVLFQMERMLEERIESVRRETTESVAEVSQRVSEVETVAKQAQVSMDQLTDLTKRIMQRRADEVEALFSAFAGNVSQETTAGVIAAATEINAIDSGGVRIPFGLEWARLRFQVERGEWEDTVVVSVESLDGRKISGVNWSPGASIEDFIAEVAVELQKAGAFVADFDAGGLFGELQLTLRTALEARTGKTELGLDPIVELPNNQWAVTTYGLESVDQPWHISWERLSNAEDDAANEQWIDMHKLREGLEMARALRYRIGPPEEPPF